MTSTSDPTDRLSKFENNMEKLEDMLHNPKESEFVVVTIPTEVAVAETKVTCPLVRVDILFLVD